MLTYKNYQEAYEAAMKDSESFWGKTAEELSWYRRWDSVLDTDDSPHNVWFRGGVCNVCYNAVDRHVEEGRGSETAIIYDSAMTGAKEKISYELLKQRVAKTAGMLKNLGVKKGDRVVIYMPMIPETIYAMLGCARIGAVHSVVFGGFAAAELSSRIADSQAKVVLAATCGYEPGRKIDYQKIVEEAVQIGDNEGFKSLAKVVMFDRDFVEERTHPRFVDDRYEDWHESWGKAAEAPCVQVAAEAPLYILYTSGSTGLPKGIERATGGHMVALKWSMTYVYDCKAGDVFWAASDFGWIVGHSYIVYGPLIAGCTTVVYEGKPLKTPDAGAFFRVIEDYKVNVMFTAPTAFRAIRREDPEGEYRKAYDIGSLRSQFLAGERCDVRTLEWIEQSLGVPVIDHWWQTETGWAITSSFLGFAEQTEQNMVHVGSAGLPVPGYDIQILDEEHHELPRGTMGDVCIKLPLPPSFMTSIWGAKDRFVTTYMTAHPGFYTTGDAGYMDDQGYLFIMSRTDDVINVAGHRLSTSAMEETLISHAGVVEAAAVGKNDDLKGQVPVAFVVPATGFQSDDLASELVAYVREKMGAVTALRQIFIVEQLPKTRSGKILRGMVQKIINGESYQVSPTIENMQAIDAVHDAIERRLSSP